MMHYRLYLVEGTKASGEISSLVKEILDPFIDLGQAKLEILDVLDNPASLYDDEVMVTPALLRIEPLPKSRVVGSINNKEVILKNLGLTIHKD